MQDALDLLDSAARLFVAALVLLGMAMLMAVVEWLVTDEDVEEETVWKRSDETLS